VLDERGDFDLIARLRGVAESSDVPAAAQANARDLADRLEGGVRIVVLGPTGVGKSALCDAIFRGHLSSAADGPARCFVQNEQTEISVAETDVARAVVRASPFGDAQVLDMAMPADKAEAKALVAQAMDRADIVLWCTEAFSPDEAALWALAPDALKDHSFLVLTQADRLAEAGVLQDRLSALQDIVAEEFHSLLPTTTAALLADAQEDEPAPPAQFAASGLKALVDAVAAMVLQGQRADLDSALLLLERNGLLMGDPPVGLAPDPKDTPASKEFKTAQETLVERAYDLAELGFDGADDDMSDIFELCGTIAEELVDAIEAEAARYPHLSAWRDSFQDGNDKIMLMTMENDVRSASDAVTILLQMRRDMAALQIH